MGIEELERIKEMMTEHNLHPTYLEHEAVITSQDAARTRGIELKQGIKALLFTNGKDDWAIINIPADKKVDVKKIASFLKWSKGDIRMATHGEVLIKTGCEIGAVPPFGHKTKIQILVDKTIYENKQNSFNIGLRTNSLSIPAKEIKIIFKLINASEGDFIKSLV